MKTPASALRYSSSQLNLLVLLRLAIGWHFLYEGVVKLWNPGWSAGSFLVDSKGLFSGLFQAMAANPGVLEIIDFLNVWGLILVGLGLMLGALTRWAAIGGMVLLGFYYLSHPALIGVQYAMPTEGSYLFINKNLIELLSLAVLFLFPTSHIIGLDRLLNRWFTRSDSGLAPAEQAPAQRRSQETNIAS